MRYKVAVGAILVALMGAFVLQITNDQPNKQLVLAAPTEQPYVLSIDPTVEWPTPEPTATPTPEPTPVPPTPKPAVVSAAGSGTVQQLAPLLPPSSCFDNPDRYEWQKYAALVGFPESAMEELAYVIKHESGGDLCAYNRSSGASCWIQQVPGAAQFFDPYTCMSQGYAKWVDGGRDFYRHWYQWWQ